MHDLHTMYAKTLELTGEVFADIADQHDNLLYRRVRPKVSDDDGSTVNIVDSVPYSVVKNSREKSCRICKEDPETVPRKGCSAVDKRYFIGYKLHLKSNEYGVFKDMQITPANVHDINFFKELEPNLALEGSMIVADKGYISAELKTEFDVMVPYLSGIEHLPSKQTVTGSNPVGIT